MSTSIKPVKVKQTALLTLQTVATYANSAGAGIARSAELDVSQYISGRVVARIGRTVVTAFTAGTEVKVLIRARGKDDAAKDSWSDIVNRGTGSMVACNTNALTAGGGAAGSGQSAAALTMSANAAINYVTNTTGNEILYFKNATVGNGEFHRAVYASTASTALWIAEDLTREQNSGNLYNGSTEITEELDLSNISEIEAVVLNNTGVDVDVEIFLETLNNYQSTTDA